MDTRHRKIDTGNTGPNTQKDRYLTLGKRHIKIDTGNIGHKTQKDRHG